MPRWSGPKGNCLAAIDVLVLAGGLGTRLRSVLGDTPKLLAPIAGQPFLPFLLAWLKNFGARRVVLALGHGADRITDHLRQQPDHDLEMVTIIEPHPLGTAGALRLANAALRSDPVLVLNGDSFVSADLCGFIFHHEASGAPATILGVEVAEAGRYGRILLDERGRIAGFAEKDLTFHGPALVSAGAYLLGAAMRNRIATMPGDSLERDVFARLPPGVLAAFCGRFDFIDIGTPQSLAQAEPLLASSFDLTMEPAS
jgi:NDP-sugar pyrophosphorylase family protein